MRRSTKIFLAIVAFALAYAILVYIQVASWSHKQFTQQDAQKFMSDLAQAFQREDASACISFAYPDAKVAGETLDETHRLLRTGFANMKDPKVEYKDIRLTNESETIAHIGATVTVVDGGTGQTVFGPQTVGFRLERRQIPHLLNLFKGYDWKIVSVDAVIPQLPPE